MLLYNTRAAMSKGFPTNRLDTTPSSGFRAAMGQIRVEFGEPERNLARAIEAIRQAARLGCRLIVLPECLDLGWTYPHAKEHAEPIPGPRSDALAQAAARSGIYVVAGLTERSGTRTYNTSILINDEGVILGKHRKINELAIAQNLYATGDRLGVVETPLGLLGMTICADNFPDALDLGHALGRMGCQVLASPCAWAVDANHNNAVQPYGEAWITSYSELARRHNLTVIGVSCVGRLTDGPWKGKKCIGTSLAVGAGGSILARGPYGEEAEAVIPVEVPIVPKQPDESSA